MFAVFKSTILSYLRRRKNALFNLLFPIFLVLLLGNVLSMVMDDESTSSNEAIKIYYYDQGSDETKEILDILKGLDTDLDLKFAEVDTLEEGKNKVRTESAVLIHLADSKINYYSNDRYLTDSSIVNSLLNGVVEGYNTTVQTFKVNPQLAGAISQEETDYEKEFNDEKIEAEKSPNAMGYYGVAELGLMVFYFVAEPTFELKREKRLKIKERIKLSGLSAAKYYFAKYLGCVFINYLSILISYLILKYAFKVNYGDNPFIMPISLLVFVLLVDAVGLMTGTIFKDTDKADVIIGSAVIPFLCLMGGGYVALDNDLGAIGNLITRISPLRSFNLGVFNYIYGGSSVDFRNWIIGAVIATIIILTIVQFKSRWEEKVNG